MKKLDWTDRDTEILIKLVEEKKANKVIAVILGKSESYICNKKRELNIGRRGGRDWNREEQQILEDELEEGASYHEIALLLNRTPLAVEVRARVLGMKETREWEYRDTCNYFIGQLKASKTIREATKKTWLREKTILKRLKYCKDEKKLISNKEYKNLLSKLTTHRRIISI